MPVTFASIARLRVSTTFSSADRDASLAFAAFPRREVAFVDRAVLDAQILLDGARPGVEVARIEADRPALPQIAARLTDGPPVSTLHIVCHGEPGALLLAGERIDVAALTARTSSLTEIAGALAEDASVVLYGCSPTAGAPGRHFIDLFEAILCAPFAASARDGAWVLCGRDGTAAQLAFAPATLAAYAGLGEGSCG